MKNIIFAAFVAAATFVAPETMNAQTAEQVAVAKRLAEKAVVVGSGEKLSDVTAIAAQKTHFYDRDYLELTIPASHEAEEQVITLQKAIRRNACSGWGIGLTGGIIQMAENFSPTFGLETTYAGKRFLVGAGAEAAISKYNKESSKAGKSFIAPIFSAKAGLVLTRFSLGGYDNMGYVAVGYEFKYILDKNENKTGESSYETETEIVTTSDYFYVEGNSMCHTGFVEARFGLKHMGGLSVGIKAFGGMYNRYYQEGSRRKAMFGASVSLYFSGAKKRVDNDVVKLQKEMEGGNFATANEMINQLRAGK